MSVCARPLLPLCSIPTMATREGHVGAHAYMNVVGIGPWYASGQQVVSTSTSQKEQDLSRTYNGTAKPNTFRKGYAFTSDAACPAV